MGEVCCLHVCVCVCVAPAYSTERTELFATDEHRTATLDLKNRRNRPPTSTPVPFADIDDDQNISSAYSPAKVTVTTYRFGGGKTIDIE